MMKIIVASKNPAKINAVLDSFVRMFPDEVFDITGISVESGVNDQPMSNDETFKGALNRATNARKAVANADFYVGLEGGIETNGDEMQAFAWMVVISKDGKIGKGRTGAFFLPQQIAALIHKGHELGEADDIVFKKQNSKQTNGAVGILTNDAITRTTYYSEAMVLALIPFKNPELY